MKPSTTWLLFAAIALAFLVGLYLFSWVICRAQCQYLPPPPVW